MKFELQAAQLKSVRRLTDKYVREATEKMMDAFKSVAEDLGPSLVDDTPVSVTMTAADMLTLIRLVNDCVTIDQQAEAIIAQAEAEDKLRSKLYPANDRVN